MPASSMRTSGCWGWYRQRPLRASDKLVGEVGDTLTECPAVDEPHVFLVTWLAEEALAGPEHDREDLQPSFGRRALHAIAEQLGADGIREVFGGAEADNAASIRCMEGAGFTRTGRRGLPLPRTPLDQRHHGLVLGHPFHAVIRPHVGRTREGSH
jgi:RimJ/RimL family protein N-acetyltransferase